MIRSIQLVMNTGVIEQINSGMVIVKQDDGMVFEAVNLLPEDQLLITAVALNELLKEYLEDSEALKELNFHLLVFIRAILNPDGKGDALQ